MAGRRGNVDPLGRVDPRAYADRPAEVDPAGSGEPVAVVVHLPRWKLRPYPLQRAGALRSPEWSWVERFGRRGTEPNELFRSDFGQNSFKIQKCSLENSKNSENFIIF